jgi:plastocyanin
MRYALCTLLAALPLLVSMRSAGGTIQGTVTIKDSKLKRVAGAYTGAPPRVVAPLPVVVFIEGAVDGSAPAVVATPSLSQRDTTFTPDLLIVPAGTTVSFPNRDPFFHNVFSYSKAKRFDLGRYPRGEQKNVTFDRAGTVSIYCEIHKWMRAGVVVVENGFNAVAQPDGSFTLAGVPPGNYKLTVWQAERGSKTVDVTVPPSGDVRVDVTL